MYCIVNNAAGGRDVIQIVVVLLLTRLEHGLPLLALNLLLDGGGDVGLVPGQLLLEELN